MSKNVVLTNNNENLYPFGIGKKQSCRWHTISIDKVEEKTFTSTSDSGRTYTVRAINGGSGLCVISGGSDITVVRQKTMIRFKAGVSGTTRMGAWNLVEGCNLWVRSLGDYYNDTSNTISPVEDVYTVDSGAYYTDASHHAVTLDGSYMHLDILWIKSNHPGDSSAKTYWSGIARINGSMITLGVDQEIQCQVKPDGTPTAYWRNAKKNTLQDVHTTLEILETV